MQLTCYRWICRLGPSCSLLSPDLGLFVTNHTCLDNIFKSRDITWPTKVRLVKAMVFPVVMYGCECWTVKKAERRRIDSFELWCWRRLLKVPWTARRSVLGFLWKEWCWSWSSSTLATSCEELTHWKRLWCLEGLGAGGEGDVLSGGLDKFKIHSQGYGHWHSRWRYTETF